MSEECSHVVFEHDTLHKYHLDLAKFIRQCWSTSSLEYEPETSTQDTLPPYPYFEDLLSICYQASMLREEEHPVRLRLILGGSRAILGPGFSAHGSPSSDLYQSTSL